LTIIKIEGDEFWIDSFFVGLGSVAADTVITIQHSLTKAGNIIGIQCTVANSGAVPADSGLIGVGVTKFNGNNPVEFGILADEIRVKKWNGSANAVSFGYYLSVYMRRPAR